MKELDDNAVITDPARVRSLAGAMLWLESLEQRPTHAELAREGLIVELVDVLRNLSDRAGTTSRQQVRARECLAGVGLPDRSIDVHSAPAEELAPYGPNFEHLLMRAARSFRAVGLRPDLVLGAKLAFTELIENVGAHSGTRQQPAPAFIAYRATPTHVEIIVADRGQGALRGLAEVGSFPNERAALIACVRDGATRRPDSAGGRGLGVVQQRIVDAGGELLFWSGGAALTVTRGAEMLRKFRPAEVRDYRGFVAAGRIGLTTART